MGRNLGKIHRSRTRIYSNNKLLSWSQLRCQKCQRFLSVYGHKYCPKCAAFMTNIVSAAKYREKKRITKYCIICQRLLPKWKSKYCSHECSIKGSTLIIKNDSEKYQHKLAYNSKWFKEKYYPKNKDRLLRVQRLRKQRLERKLERLKATYWNRKEKHKERITEKGLLCIVQ
jgi:hypothetical protein